MKRKYSLFAWLMFLWLVSCKASSPLSTSNPAVSPTFTEPPIIPTNTKSPDTPVPEETLQADRTAYSDERLSMVTNTILARGIDDPEVIRAMKTVPRHLFVPEDLARIAYTDRPLPIGYGQTISQPYMVALMTQLLDLDEDDKVLEIGTGSGYQAAILAEIGYLDVYSIEIVPELAVQAESNLANAGYDTIHLKQDDGYFGWEEFAPFDAIIVTAAPDHIPAPLAAQLKDGGIMVIPIGPPGWYQTLWKFTNLNGNLVAENMGSVAFVPFTGEGISTQQP